MSGKGILDMVFIDFNIKEDHISVQYKIEFMRIRIIWSKLLYLISENFKDVFVVIGQWPGRFDIDGEVTEALASRFWSCVPG